MKIRHATRMHHLRYESKRLPLRRKNGTGCRPLFASASSIECLTSMSGSQGICFPIGVAILSQNRWSTPHNTGEPEPSIHFPGNRVQSFVVCGSGTSM